MTDIDGVVLVPERFQSLRRAGPRPGGIRRPRGDDAAAVGRVGPRQRPGQPSGWIRLLPDLGLDLRPVVEPDLHPADRPVARPLLVRRSSFLMASRPRLTTDPFPVRAGA